MTRLNQTHTDRWKDPNSFNSAWSSRSRELLQMFLDFECQPDVAYEMAEFGCGPYAPFAALAAENKVFSVKKHDIKAWDVATTVVDLNDSNVDFEEADIATFSGVLEYLDDVERVLKSALSAHRYLLLSYAFLPANIAAFDHSFIAAISKRSSGNGWRNHLTNHELIKMIANIGVIVQISIWEKSQTLILIRKFGTS